MSKPIVWFPYLIKQRGLGVKDLRNVNFKATLIPSNRSEAEAWQPNLEKPSIFDTHRAITDPSLLDRNRKIYLNKGSQNPELTYGGDPYQDEDGQWVQDIIPTRGQSVLFEYKGFKTFLFQEEYDLISEILDSIEEITINTTDGLSPLFQILAVVKKD